jgi:hypothetical protein
MSRPLSKRERGLATVVGLIVLVGGSLVLGSSYLGQRTALQARIASQKRQLHSMQELLDQRVFWEMRERWLQTAQPKLENSDNAGVELLDYVQKLAKKNSVVLENPAIHAPERRTDCVSVILEVDSKCPWSPLVAFLGDLQSPERFIALENVNLKVDGSDATQVHGHFKIARWYAPQ